MLLFQTTRFHSSFFAAGYTTTGASALLAANATSATMPEVYGGANMPSGYTASALISVVPTNSSGQIVALSQNSRTIYYKGNANGPSAISAQIFISGYEF